ncbi:bacillithiol biosynthesis cysteine-adding enzyme BshC [Paenibacillus hamazuiensis]|uniref:bacillithiol biosynthesis cysteine-adding enzyme BshC n=1 Tax=Paenibacillus hamazuiensis TaxID=2936508 RepID=UPI00200DBF4D|nr:bacillithiol biosynthesis cysteine-adding enzyme BshC [Paenibacillus hamazuiensis]
MNIKTVQWKSSQPLAEDYIRRFAHVEPLFEYNPWLEAEWKRRAAWLDAERPEGAERSGLVRVLERFNRDIAADDAALASVHKLADKETLAVVGGQQAGLFTGPLLVIYKALTLLKSAEAASRKLGRPVVPIFWIAGEDHDFDEVNHIFQLTGDMQLEKLKLEPPGDKRTSVSRTAISPEAWEAALLQLDAGLMQTEFKAGLLDKLKEIAGQSRTLVDYFGRMMAWLFRGTGLAFVDSDDPELRRLEAPMFARLIERHGDVQAAVQSGAERVSALGFAPQVDIQEGNANLFVYDREERVLLYADGDGFTTRRKDRSFSKAQLLDWAHTAPERLSNNVMTRPLMQDFLFPVLATVLGPGEIAYWGLTRETFRTMGMQMPLIVPRLEFTLLEGTVAKHMGKYDLTFDDVIHRFEEKKEAWLASQDNLHLDERFGEVKRQFKAGYEPLIELIAGINPGLKKLGETNMSKIVEQIDYLEQKAADAHRSQFDASLRQISRIGWSILPGGKPQERVYNVVSYLNRYGDRWLRELLDADLQADGVHRIVEL